MLMGLKIRKIITKKIIKIQKTTILNIFIKTDIKDIKTEKTETIIKTKTEDILVINTLVKEEKEYKVSHQVNIIISKNKTISKKQ